MGPGVGLGYRHLNGEAFHSAVCDCDGNISCAFYDDRDSCSPLVIAVKHCFSCILSFGLNPWRALLLLIRDCPTSCWSMVGQWLVVHLMRGVSSDGGWHSHMCWVSVREC